MCQANIYMAKDGIEYEVMRDVDAITVIKDRISIEDFRGRRKELHARIVSINFDRHKVTIEEIH